ncbi:hypothetical protein M413DRAFT_443346 [Hebeloma cylindrosporum]|uniref:F-box domain-containing protein n=1 Tax=Hebeloma cylindrosporum TaxID=76867 RepID=A0A0C3C645_HEBCY|nr:hypothetical protein M413DRAFT_443346 [Hebeloma cylindrosporum h7]
MPLKSKKRVKQLPLETPKAAELVPASPNKGFNLLELPLELITCKSWRYLFFPLLWERLEPCLTHSKNVGTWYKVYGESLIRKSSLVCENPEIASHVRSMSVILSRYSTDTVLPACVRAIEALPNIHTLQIIRTHDKMATVLNNHFEGHIFPQVRTITLPGHAHNILRSCPEVRRIISNTRMNSTTLVSVIAKVCKKVEEVEGFRGPESVMKRLAKAVPNLRSIKFDYPIPSSDLQHFYSLKKLSRITFCSKHATEEHAMADNECLARINLAKNIVRKAEGRRNVTVEYYDDNRSQGLTPCPGWSRAFNVDI